MTLDTAWPPMPGALVVARFARIYGDGPDADDRPDWIAPVGTELTLTPSVTGPLVYDPTGAKIIVEVGPFRAVVDANGFAVTKDGGHPIRLVPTDDPLMSRTGWLWTCSWAGGKVSFPAPSSGTINIADYIVAPPGNPVVEDWIDRIPELIDAAGSLVGIESVTSDAGDIVVTLTDGEVDRFPMPPGAPGPANSLSVGIVSTGPAAASITGVSPEQVLNLTIPKGDPGPAGGPIPAGGTPGQYPTPLAGGGYGWADVPSGGGWDSGWRNLSYDQVPAGCVIDYVQVKLTDKGTAFRWWLTTASDGSGSFRILAPAHSEMLTLLGHAAGALTAPLGEQWDSTYWYSAHWFVRGGVYSTLCLAPPSQIAGGRAHAGYAYLEPLPKPATWPGTPA